MLEKAERLATGRTLTTAARTESQPHLFAAARRGGGRDLLAAGIAFAVVAALMATGGWMVVHIASGLATAQRQDEVRMASEPATPSDAVVFSACLAQDPRAQATRAAVDQHHQVAREDAPKASNPVEDLVHHRQLSEVAAARPPMADAPGASPEMRLNQPWGCQEGR